MELLLGLLLIVTLHGIWKGNLGFGSLLSLAVVAALIYSYRNGLLTVDLSKLSKGDNTPGNGSGEPEQQPEDLENPADSDATTSLSKETKKNG